jgi:hypothetical protein
MEAIAERYQRFQGALEHSTHLGVRLSAKKRS